MVSVIVPNYCHARFLDQRIQSILNQSYQDFELIILDDRSPDNGASRAIIEKYRDNPHVSHIVYNEENSGSPFKQWDKGIKLAKGDLIWIAESDDYCKKAFLETLVNEFERDDNLTLAYTLVKRVDAEGMPVRELCISPFGVSRLTGTDYIRKYMIFGNHCRNASACVFKKAAYDKTDKQYMTYKAGGDMLFWVEIAEHGNVVIVNKKLSFFRSHSQRVTPKSSKSGVILLEYKKTIDHIIQTGILSEKRKKMMIDYAHYKLLTCKFEREDHRENLFLYWNFSGVMNWYTIVKVYVRKSVQMRLGIHL